MVLAGRYFDEIGKSLVNVLVAFASAYLTGVIIGTILHGHKTTREILDPLFATYYAIPVFAFYPLFIVMINAETKPPAKNSSQDTATTSTQKPFRSSRW